MDFISIILNTKMKKINNEYKRTIRLVVILLPPISAFLKTHTCYKKHASFFNCNKYKLNKK